MASTQVLQQSLRGVVFENSNGSYGTISWQSSPSRSKAEEWCSFVGDNSEKVRTVDIQWAPGIRATIPMTDEELDVEVAVDGSLRSGNQRGSRLLNLGPRYLLGEMWHRFLKKDKMARTAVICQAFGDEMPSSCQGCDDGPFDGCVVYRDQNTACSNCIYTEREQRCKWNKPSDINSPNEHGFIPHEGQQADEPDSENQKASSEGRSAGRSRRGPDSDDQDYASSKKRKADDSDKGEEYTPSKIRSEGQTAQSAPGRHSERAAYDSKRPRRSSVESDPKVPELSPLIDLTGEDE